MIELFFDGTFADVLRDAFTGAFENSVCKGLTARAAEAAADRLAEQEPSDARSQRAAALAESALRVHADLAAAAEADRRMARRFSAAHPSVALTEVAALASDVHDLDGLREIGSELSNGPAATAPQAAS